MRILCGIAVALVMTISMPTLVLAQGGQMNKHAMSKQGTPGYGKKQCQRPRWKATLTTEQRQKMGRMHLALSKTLVSLKAQKKVKKAELKLLLVQDKTSTKSIHRKIDEILAIKRQIMRKRYEHLLDMRNLLTPEQRVSFDLGLIRKSGHRRYHKRHH